MQVDLQERCDDRSEIDNAMLKVTQLETGHQKRTGRSTRAEATCDGVGANGRINDKRKVLDARKPEQAPSSCDLCLQTAIKQAHRHTTTQAAAGAPSLLQNATMDARSRNRGDARIRNCGACTNAGCLLPV